uniref:Annexin n=1 Tax=Ditylenchus dipsaci TaxID=166011 RepID=A0A915D9I0_9BILA
MKGMGCDKQKVIRALTSCNNQQRQEIAKVYKVQYGSDLNSDLKKELSGDFENLVLALMTPPAQYDAQQLKKAFSGIGTKENILIEILTTRSNAQINELKHTYKQLFGKELEKELMSETSGDFQKVLVSLCDARSLYKAGTQKFGTDEGTFNSILASQNFNQLRLIFDEYKKTAGHTIEEAIQKSLAVILETLI